MSQSKYLFWGLQRYAEGGDGGAEGAASDAANSATTADGQQGTEQQSKATFDEILKDPAYKSEYDKRVRRAVTGRLKASTKRMEALSPVIDALGRRYNINLNDPAGADYEALAKSFLADDAMIEQEAEELGYSVEQYREVVAKDQRIAELERRERQAADEREWAAREAEAEALREIYPNFDLSTELENDQFCKLFAALEYSGFKGAMKQAYEAAHREEIMAGAMNYAVKKTKEKVSEAIRSGQKRPAENGNASGGQAKIDPSGMSAAQIEDVRRRVMRGERVDFS